MTGSLASRRGAPFLVATGPATPDPHHTMYNRVQVCACTRTDQRQRGRGGDRRTPTPPLDKQEIVGVLPYQQKPGENCRNSANLLQFLFFYFYSIISKKKKYKSTEVGKVAENQQVKTVLFWTFQECRFVRTVQEYGARKECGKSTAVKALTHNEIRCKNRGARTFVQLFSKVSAHP